MSSRSLEDVLKTYGQDGYGGLDQDVLKMSSSRRMFAGLLPKEEDLPIRDLRKWKTYLNRKTKVKDLYQKAIKRGKQLIYEENNCE